DKKYRVRGKAGIEEDLQELPESLKQRVTRVFLADGNALAMPKKDMIEVLHTLADNLPSLQRVGTYGYAKDVRDKSVEDLEQIREAGLGIVYLGLETGDDELLRWSRKGITTKDNIDSCQHIREAGIPISLTIILGLGGIEHSERHAKATADALNAIDPDYVGALTLMLPKGTPIYEMEQKGEFVQMTPMEILQELHILVKNTELSECVFRTNHASNYLPLGGTLSRDKDRILATLEETLQKGDESQLRPGYLRGL
ncbi:MAG: radical SAM protein, partial [Candidatus Thorarchaeota archaeon]|nr:radical SAM protein [Candidatus Thorarchaeota archaeon]